VRLNNGTGLWAQGLCTLWRSLTHDNPQCRVLGYRLSPYTSSETTGSHAPLPYVCRNFCISNAVWRVSI
jgi:hypothetical protein